jgi:hypothetical protein
MKQLNFGLVGYKFMGKAHSNAIARLPMFFDCGAEIGMKAICGRAEEWVAQAVTKGHEQADISKGFMIKQNPQREKVLRPIQKEQCLAFKQQ